MASARFRVEATFLCTPAGSADFGGGCDGWVRVDAWDGSGNLYRNDGKGNGSFGSRVKIASGWQDYKGLF
ncbi:hypothetical protein [Streptomyces sp. R41]|uniref:Uncharacterized protein n=1 Tax=Streptomyces sp. R41 TaxID=3238632 RepID=A0AB39RIJ7_9ACTN